MKQLISTGIALVLILSLLAGCGQEAPVASPEPETRAPEAAEEDYVLPETFSGDWTGVEGYLHVTAHAPVEAPYGLTLPTASVRKKQITQADADRLMDAFLGDAQLYKNWMGKWKDMPENYEKKASRTLEQREFWGLGLDNVYAETENGRVDLIINNPETMGSSAVFCLEHYANFMRPNAIPAEQTPLITREEAEDAAEALLEQLGLTHYLCQYIRPVTYVDGDPFRYEEDGTQVPYGERLGEGYDLFYVPSVNGISGVITENAWGTSTPENEPIDAIWSYECIRIAVNDQKNVVFFHWESPQEIPVIQDPSPALIPFREIAEAFPELIMTANAEYAETNAVNGFDIFHEYQVDQVELNWMRIRDKYNYQEGTYVPVWDFRATTSSHTEEEAYQYINDMEPRHEIVLTVNALDGTVIDRQLGY